MPQRAVIYSIGPSPLDKNIIWAGTDDGLVHVTTDGGKVWKDVTPKALSSWDKISQIDAGHFDKNTAYISVNAFRKDDLKPHIFSTHDGGATWKEITKGMNPSGPVNAVREDPKQKGLLFAGTEREVYFSSDDGENWQSLRMNMPATSIRDLVIHENDLVIGTHGRSVWILDNISPLREMASVASAKSAYLFQPVPGIRVRDNMFSDTPLPPEEPTGENPADGVALDYFLPAKAVDVTLEVLDKDGKVVRKYSSKDKAQPFDSTALQHPVYWIKPASTLPVEAGHHRFIWDLRHEDPRGADCGLTIAAVYKKTPFSPRGPFVSPGTYKVRLIVGGKSTERTIDVRLDPRVTITEKDLQLQTDYTAECYQNYQKLQMIREEANALLTNSKTKWKANEKETLQALIGAGEPQASDVLYGSVRETPLDKETMKGLQEKYLYLLNVLQSADVKPTTQAIQGIEKLRAVYEGLNQRWNVLKK
jgi:hypothetical protein